MQALHISPYQKKYVHRIYSARLNVILSLSVLGLGPSIFCSFSIKREMPFGFPMAVQILGSLMPYMATALCDKICSSTFLFPWKKSYMGYIWPTRFVEQKKK